MNKQSLTERVPQIGDPEIHEYAAETAKAMAARRPNPARAQINPIGAVADFADLGCAGDHIGGSRAVSASSDYDAA